MAKRVIGESRVWVWGVLVLILLLSPSGLSWGREAPDLQTKAHFIVLIDDSKDTFDLQKFLPSELPAFLYSGTKEGLPAFRPGLDELTVAFFTIHLDGPRSLCGEEWLYSVLPNHMFQVVDIPPGLVRSQARFEAALRGWLSFPCRKQGHLSPIGAAPTMILPFLAKRFPENAQFSHVFVILAHNEKFNPVASPAFELVRLRDVAPVGALRDVKEGAELASKQASLFSLEPRAAYRGKGDVYLDVLEALPHVAPSPEVGVSRPPEIQLDRIAISDDQLRVGPSAPALSELRVVLPNPAAEGGRLIPLRLTWSFSSAKGGPWAIGSKQYPQSEQALDLEKCPLPCRRENNQVVVPLFGLGGDSLLGSSEKDPEGDGRLRFQVAFRYDAPDSYGHLTQETRPLEIPLRLAPAELVPGGPFSRDIVLDNQHLTDLFEKSDREGPAGGLTQQAARQRILRQRNWAFVRFLIIALAVLAAALLAILYYLYRTAYHRPFRPVLEWASAGEVVIDFNHPDASRILVGTLTVRNPEPVPWFGERLGNIEQPTRRARFTMSFQPLEASGLRIEGEGAPIGFLASEKGDAHLTTETEESISEGKRIFVFLAGELIQDLLGHNGTEGPRKIPIDLGLNLQWRTADRPDGTLGSVETVVSFNLRLEPEEPRAPHVELLPETGELFFRKGQSIQAGRFVFESRAKHSFACPFATEYLVQAFRENFPLGGEPIRLAAPQAEVAPGARLEIPVLLACDGEVIPNPDPAVQIYEFRLVGPFDSESDPGPHTVFLRRDPTRAEIELKVTYLSESYEIFWAAEDQPKYRRVGSGGLTGPEVEIPGGSLELERPFELPFGEAHPAMPLITFEVGNSAKAGRGKVEVSVTRRLVLTPGFGERLHFVNGRTMEDLLRLYQGDEAVDDLEQGVPQVRVREGEPPQMIDLRIEPVHIERIDDAVIEARNCHVEVDLLIQIRGDRDDKERQRKLLLKLPLGLERLPGPNWMCIDFGTSAIAVGVGSGVYDSFRMIPLQDVQVRSDGSTYGTTDLRNPEMDTPFLPSWVICDADQRRELSGQEDGWNPGTPLFRPASLRPGDPSFLGLPALRSHLEEKPGRVIYSLKSWLGKGDREIRIQDELTYVRQGKEVPGRALPLDAVVESGFAALAEAYLKGQTAEQIVICHPNTFTAYHRERLHTIASRALMRPFHISSPRHIRLLSESDAVAYDYCMQRMRQNPRDGVERLLVYDFGAGTLDLSLLTVDWNREPCYPKKWVVEARLGVPIAGNYMDEILARMVDELLRDANVLSNEHFLYAFPLVAKSSENGSLTRDHRRSIHQFHGDLKDAKHAWDGISPFVVRVGGLGGGWSVVQSVSDESQVPQRPPEPQQSGIFTQDNFLLLSVPADRVHGDPGVVEYLEFVTETVVDAALDSAELEADAVDTLIVSGRASLWPDLRKHLGNRFPNAVTVSEESGITMKEVVVRGAIARQELAKLVDEAPPVRGRLGVLLANDTLLVPEEDWGNEHGIDLTSSISFRLVQVELRCPNPREDMQSLRRHFYTDVTAQLYLRDSLWRDDPRLFVRREQRNGKNAIVLSNSKGQTIIVGSQNAGVAIVMTPPWPVGKILLDPKGSTRARSER